MRTPTYKGLSPASTKARKAAKAASKKTGTKPELLLRRALWRAGYRYRKNVSGLPGNPDLVFLGPRVAIFCDGDFWHGKDWTERRSKLANGHNAQYWIAKIERNIERDEAVSQSLKDSGWIVLRFWESEIKADVDAVVAQVSVALRRVSRSAANGQHRKGDRPRV